MEAQAIIGAERIGFFPKRGEDINKTSRSGVSQNGTQTLFNDLLSYGSIKTG